MSEMVAMEVTIQVRMSALSMLMTPIILPMGVMGMISL